MLLVVLEWKAPQARARLVGRVASQGVPGRRYRPAARRAAVCVPAGLFGRTVPNVIVPLVFAIVMVARAVEFTMAAGLWEEEDDNGNDEAQWMQVAKQAMVREHHFIILLIPIPKPMAFHHFPRALLQPNISMHADNIIMTIGIIAH